MSPYRRILIVFGTRPEAIKMAPVVLALRQRVGAALDCRVCVTAQHREMLDPVLHQFGIDADFDLDIMREAQDLTDVTARVLTGMRGVLRDFGPDLVLVQGDTTTTFAAALAAYYERIAVGHVEAGLRTGDIHSPWPEEMNRHLTSVIAVMHFAPTANARDNLMREGIAPDRIHVTGNTVIDALFHVVRSLDADADARSRIEKGFGYLDPSKRLVLVTCHRRESFGEGLENICRALKEIGRRRDVQIVYPVHLNPNVRDTVRRVLGDTEIVHAVAPLDYVPFVYLMNRAFMVMTDSGGIQEEAPSLGKPVLVMRDTTERPEGVAAQTVRLVGTNFATIVAEAGRLLDDSAHYRAMAGAHNPYGDGHAAERIVRVLLGDD